MIDVQNISKKYGKKIVVDNVTFRVERGEIFGLLGPNGAGKSTILGMMATVLKPSGGDIIIDGISMAEARKNMLGNFFNLTGSKKKEDAFHNAPLAKLRKLISYVPQQISLHKTLTVKDNLTFWGNISAGKVSREKILEIAALIGLEDRLNDRTEKLSEGMKRRLNIGVSLLSDPQIIIMDEPTLGVDIKSKKELVDFILTMASSGKTIIYTSHDLREIMQLCKRVALLNEGNLMFVGTFDEAAQKVSGPFGNDPEKVLAELGEWWS